MAPSCVISPDWRLLLVAVPSTLFLGFFILESQLIDSRSLLAELDGLKRNVTELQQLLQSQSGSPPASAVSHDLDGARRKGPLTAHSKKCLEIYKSLLPVTSRDRSEVCRTFHFIHVAKNGGTALNEWLQDNDLRCLFSRGSFVHTEMQTAFKSRRKGTCYVTLLRDPVERWISGFLSRWRKGCPSHCSPWTKGEAHIFEMFQTPSELAEAFNSSDSEVRYTADMAQKIVEHLHRGYANYFPYGKAMMPYLVFAGLTCKLETDAFALLRAIGVPDAKILKLPGIKRVHENPAEFRYLQVGLSAHALENIRRKVKADYDVFRMMAEDNIIESENISNACEEQGSSPS